MENHLRSKIIEIQDLNLKIFEKIDDTNLTSAQKEAYKNEKELHLKSYAQSKGIIYTEKWNDNVIYYQFEFSEDQVKDQGIISDVNPSGTFPIKIIVDDKTLIHYEPRKLDKIPVNILHEISNSEFLHLKKGDIYTFQGKIAGCTSYNNGKIINFRIAGRDDSLVDKENLRKATDSGTSGSIKGALIGFAIGVVIYIGLSIILGIYNAFTTDKVQLGFIITFIIIITPTILVGLNFYYLHFSKIRKKTRNNN